MNKAQHTTMYIKHLADSANFKVVTLNKTCSDLTGKCSEMPNDFIYRTLAASEKNETATLKLDYKI